MAPLPQVTVKDFVTGLIAPLTIDSVFEWPPDVFALTSALLKRTGAYRYVVSPPSNATWPPASIPAEGGWTGAISDIAAQWIRSVADQSQLALPTALVESKTSIVSYWDVITLEDLREIQDDGKDWRLCSAILSLHAMADSACNGFGTPTAPSHCELVHFLADHLLSTYGSLSRLAKAKGVVLPKMRTPQTGVTLRATSLFATWQETEVEAVWRTTPWVNGEENTLNVMILPWPSRIDPFWFQGRLPSKGHQLVGPQRYFTYEPKEAICVDRIVQLVEQSSPLASRIHIVVLPELALTCGELRDLQLKLANGLDADKVPLIITGLRDWEQLTAEDVPPTCDACNSVVLSIYFARKWYDLRQDKHHRWKLDRKQVQQYTIGGVLASNRSWWEDLAVSPRKLSILAPTGWLALCPLICEDLAQLEPVSELIRGVGPTLLVALLLDGPQLPSRWSARYASVMADDPGTSVLTVTSRGMAARSTPRTPSNRQDKPERLTVALWRDTYEGFKEIQIDPEDEGVILTLSADWREEMSADGRSDGGAAAVFVLNGAQPVRLRDDVTTPEPRRDVTKSTKVMKGTKQDLYELTTMTQLVDAALDADSNTAAQILAVVRGRSADSPNLPPEAVSVVDIIDEAKGRWWPMKGAERDFNHAVEYFDGLLAKLPQGLNISSEGTPKASDTAMSIERWKQIVEITSSELSAQTAESQKAHRRTVTAVLHCVLWAVHNRLDRLKRVGRLTSAGAELIHRILDTLASREADPIG
jgi:hypothetical protein